MLSPEQLTELMTWGIVRVDGMIPSDMTARMLDLVWSALAEEYGICRDRPETWHDAPRHIGIRRLDRTKPFAGDAPPLVLAAADTLLGAGCWESRVPWRPLVTFARPEPEGPWDVPTGGWHYDRPFESHELEDFPALQVFGFLAPTQPTGGGTLVLAGSHHLVRRETARRGGGGVHAKVMKAVLGSSHAWLRDLWGGGDAPEDRVRKFMHDECSVDGVRLRVLELTGEPGDAYLMNMSLLHNTGPNVLPAPRMMIVKRFNRKG